MRTAAKETEAMTNANDTARRQRVDPDLYIRAMGNNIAEDSYRTCLRCEERLDSQVVEVPGELVHAGCVYQEEEILAEIN